MTTRPHRSKACVAGVWIVGVALAAASAPQGAAQAPPSRPSAATGKVIADRLCTGCHVVEANPSAAVPASGVPSFRAIATKTGQTGSSIRDALISPPHQMPDMQLTIREIEDIVAYLETLRADPSGTPLIQPPGGEKPVFPRPS